MPNYRKLEWQIRNSFAPSSSEKQFTGKEDHKAKADDENNELFHQGLSALAYARRP
jgi:hypothetical protein